MKKFVLGLLACSVFGSANTFADETQTETKSESKSVQIRVQSTSKSDSDGDDDVEVTSSVSGKIVIVGPDGKKQEFELGDELPEGFKNFNLSGMNNVSFLFDGDKEKEESRYMIGVMCEPASDVLRSHLHLGDKGLVVTSISKDMPAAEAGLQKGDILLGVGDKEISSLDALVEAVAASDGSAMTFSVIQEGEKKDLDISPKMSSSKSAMDGLPEGLQNLVLDGSGVVFSDLNSVDFHDGFKTLQNDANQMIIRRIGPGFRISDHVDFDVEEIVAGHKGAGASKKGLTKQLQTIRKRLAEVEKELEALSEKEQ